MFHKLNRKSGLVILAFAALTLLAAGGGSDARDRGKNSSAGDPGGVTDDTAPIIGGVEPARSPKPAADAISAEAGRSLLSEFQRAQSAELKGMDHRNRLEIKEFKTTQAARLKEWERQEKDALHKYMEDHHSGSDRRVYIIAYRARHVNYVQAQSDEFNQRIHDSEARLSSLRDQQSQRLKEFKSALDRNERPSAKLWPGAS